MSFTALHWAVVGDHADIVALLCAAPGATAAFALKSDAGYDHCTPLGMAIHRNRPSCEAVLRAHGAPE